MKLNPVEAIGAYLQYIVILKNKRLGIVAINENKEWMKYELKRMRYI